MDDEGQLVGLQHRRHRRQVQVRRQQRRVFRPTLESDEDGESRIFFFGGFVADGLELGLKAAEVERVDDAFEELLTNASLTGRRPRQVVSEKFLGQNWLNGMIWWRVEDHLAPLVDRQAVGVDHRTLQPLADRLQRFF